MCPDMGMRRKSDPGKNYGVRADALSREYPCIGKQDLLFSEAFFEICD